MDNTPSADEQPKTAIAAKVITEKRLYFVPSKGRSYEAESVDDAIAQAEAEEKELATKNNKKVSDAK